MRLPVCPLCDRTANDELRRPVDASRDTAELKAFAESILTNEEYRRNLRARVIAGEAAQIEMMLYGYAYGQPKETVKHEDDATRTNPLAVDAELRALIGSCTEHGQRLVEKMWRIARGAKVIVSITTAGGEVREVRLRPSLRERMDAMAWLADRGWGRVSDADPLVDETAEAGDSAEAD